MSTRQRSRQGDALASGSWLTPLGNADQVRLARFALDEAARIEVGDRDGDQVAFVAGDGDVFDVEPDAAGVFLLHGMAEHIVARAAFGDQVRKVDDATLAVQT